MVSRPTRSGLCLRAALAIALVGSGLSCSKGAGRDGSGPGDSASAGGTSSAEAADGASGGDEEKREPRRECAKRRARCEVHGVEGRCVRGGWCLPLGPGCIHDVDCDDGNPCTKDRCDEGECVLEPTEGSCELEDDEEGQCRLGRCEPTHDDGCVDDSDCPESHNDCSTVACTDAGECEASTRPDGESCKTVSDAPGTCREGRCRIDEERASERQTDCTVRRNRFGRRYRDCDESLRFLLPEEDLSDARDAIRDQIEEKVHYDMLVGLVELPDGGYNFVTANLRSRDTVRGLVDPSFVAFTIAGYTSGTGWRSRQLQVWIRPYEEGWAVPTAGSRAAVERGRSASRLGLFGVVNVEAYREWLEKNFEKLTPPERYVTDGDTGTDGS